MFTPSKKVRRDDRKVSLSEETIRAKWCVTAATPASLLPFITNKIY